MIWSGSRGLVSLHILISPALDVDPVIGAKMWFMKCCIQARVLVGLKGMTNGEYSPLVVLNPSRFSKVSEFHTFQ